MTSPEVQRLVQRGWQRIIITSGSIEQHGYHLPLETDLVLAEALAVRAALQLGRTLVAPVIPIGCAAHHMAFAGTVSVSREAFMAYVEQVAESVIAHGFTQLLFTAFHGGNFAPSLEAAQRVQRAHPAIEVHTALDLHQLFAVTNGVIRECFPDRTALDCHAGCVETSMLWALSQAYVRVGAVANGAECTTLPSLHDMRRLSATGVVGIVDGYSTAIGERLFARIVDFMIASWGLGA
ncbi:MAG: creatininase family protein [Deltaproteobacteria bacterium]|nr:creatininase family protein [Deltaproteobacteria bacterium]